MEASYSSKNLLSFNDLSRKGARSNTRVSETDPMDLTPKQMERFKEIRNILSIPPFKRTKEQLGLLTQFLLGVDFFRKIRDDEFDEAVFECAKFIKHYYPVVKTIPLKACGEMKRFYLLLSGDVLLYKEDCSREEAVKVEKHGYFGETFHSSSHDYYQAVCLGPAHFMVLDRIDFKRIRDHILNIKFKIVLKFLGTIPILSTLSRNYIEKIISMFRVKVYKRKEFIFREKDKSEYVYFIDDGEFIITRHSRMSSHSPSRISTKPKLVEYIATHKLAIIGKGELIGDEDILNNNPLRSYTCECYSERGKVLFISAQDFFLYLAKTDEIIDILKSRTTAREMSRNKISRVSSEMLKLRLPSPKILNPLPRSPIFSPRMNLKELLARSGTSTPIRSISPRFKIPSL